MITTTSQQRSATIFQFPIGGRAGLQSVKTEIGAVQPKSEFAVTDAWYHQEAIREAQQATKQ